MKGKRLKQSIAAAVAVVSICSVSAYAAYHFLAPADVADALTSNSALSAAFAESSATWVNERQSTGGYDVTFLGTVTGDYLMDALGTDTLGASKTYAVVAIENADGSPMPQTTDDDYNTFCVTALVHGKSFAEANNGLFNATALSFVRDGVQYELYECDDLEIFSGIGVYLGVVETFGNETQAFVYDPDTGLYSVNPDYDKINALFDLPLDLSKADDAAAEAYLQAQAETVDDGDDEDSFGSAEVDVWVRAFSDSGYSLNEDWASVLETAHLDEAQTASADEDGNVDFVTSNGAKERDWIGIWPYDADVEVYHGADSDGTLEGTTVSTLTQNADGSFTLRYYSPVIEQ